jgi:thiosulfate dehydrogenase
MNTSHPALAYRSRRLLILLFILVAIIILSAATSGRATPPPQTDLPPGDPLRGGKLYVNWYLITSAEFGLEQHPLWPENPNNQVPPQLTWRCVNCHGWDYLGSDGITMTGLYRRAGWPGLFGMTADTPEEILPWLDGQANPDHNFIDYLAPQDLADLAAFLSSGLVSPELIADLDNRFANGTVEVGQTAYQDQCMACHGGEGEKINLGSLQTPIFLGDMAWINPWHISHILRYGHLSARVPPAAELNLSFSQQIDILAFLQTLPTASTLSEDAMFQFDPESQAPTAPLAFGALAITTLIYLTVFFTLKRRSSSHS